jgi:GNAT superfamily N-acetyltransferase
VVGSLGLEASRTRWRMRHVGSIGMAVRDDWQGRGIGTALMEAALDLEVSHLLPPCCVSCGVARGLPACMGCRFHEEAEISWGTV